MDISIISVFPEYFDSMQLSLLGKAQAHGIVRIQALDLRDWTHDVPLPDLPRRTLPDPLCLPPQDRIPPLPPVLLSR